MLTGQNYSNNFKSYKLLINEYDLNKSLEVLQGCENQ